MKPRVVEKRILSHARDRGFRFHLNLSRICRSKRCKRHRPGVTTASRFSPAASAKAEFSDMQTTPLSMVTGRARAIVSAMYNRNFDLAPSGAIESRWAATYLTRGIHAINRALLGPKKNHRQTVDFRSGPFPKTPSCKRDTEDGQCLKLRAHVDIQNPLHRSGINHHRFAQLTFHTLPNDHPDLAQPPWFDRYHRML